MSKDPLDLFITRVQAQERTRKQHSQHVDNIADTKSKALVPVRKLLKQIQDMGIKVHSYEGDRNLGQIAHRFEVYENESSPSFQPGRSLFFNHPAPVEIAIPNEWDKKNTGAISICCSGYHPEADLLRGPFPSIEDACIALAEFLARSTVSMESHPRPLSD